MSGNLFEEGAKGDELTNGKSIEKPPFPRNDTKLCGLYNQGATCYLNVLIQTLLHTPEFREPLFRLTPKDLNLLINSNDQNSTTSNANNFKVRKIIVELQRLFAEMLQLNLEACSSTRLTDSFGWQSNENIDHQDVHELNRLLFDAIQKSLQGTKQSDLIRLCYEGSIINYTQCKNCQTIFKRTEDYHDLPLVVQDSPNLQTSLANMFTVAEQLVGDNKYRCSSCSNKLCDAEKWAKITKLPPILTLPLQRFVYDIKTTSRQKNTASYEFPFQIDLRDFCDNSVTETDYDLFAVVIHRGTCYAGHYYVYIKDVDHIGKWTQPPVETSITKKSKKSDKTNASENSSENIEDDKMEPLDLVKTLLLAHDGWVDITYLHKTYKENMSSAWTTSRGANAKFKKFLRNHSKIFEVDDTRVRLIEQQNYVMDIDEKEVISMDYELSQPDRILNTSSNDDDHWFCFDDTVVTCVTQESIKRHYDQNDCAYMLFYRQKRRHSTDKPYSIPEWLSDEISEKNKTLENNRILYDKCQNQFTVTIYPSEWFEIIDDCRLNLNNNQQFIFPDQYGEHVFDKRTNLNQFFAELHKTYGSNSHFYVAKKLRSGQLHIINELLQENIDAELKKTDLFNHRHMIVYKSPSKLPDRILRGEEFEPIMLNIVYGFSNSHNHSIATGSVKYPSKSMTLLQLKELLYYEYYGNHDEQKLRQIRIGKLNLQEKNNRKLRREYKPDEERQMLAQLDLQDGDTLGIDDKNAVVTNWKTLSANVPSSSSQNNVSLTIRNSVNNYNTKPMTYSCLNTTLIGEVKLIAIHAFDLPLDISQCRLHVDDDHDVAHIPLYDHQTVDSIEFQNNNTCLCLKLGQSLHENDILLYILTDREPCTLELVVDKDMTLSNLWVLVKSELKMNENDNEYHMCQVDPSLEGDGPPLDDFDQTIQVNKLTNGTQLTIRHGSVAARNHVRLKVFRIINKFYTPHQAIHTQPKYEMIPLETLFELPVISPFNVLRERIAKFVDFGVPSIYTKDYQPSHFIRLYSVGNDQSLAIIHEPILTTLKQAKDLDSYAFELLSHPESICKNDLVLNIVHDKDDDNNHFQHQFELHWQLKENVIAKYEYLEQHILDRLVKFMTNTLEFKNVSKQALKITLARYFPERAQWIVIDRSLPSMTNQNGKRKAKKSNASMNTTGSNLRKEPYKLSDLAVIGVLEGENLKAHDFDTAYDIKRRQEIDIEKEQKKQNRGRNTTENDRDKTSETSRRKSPETTMRIDVDDFDT